MSERAPHDLVQEPDRLPGWTLVLILAGALLFSTLLIIVNAWTIDSATASLKRHGRAEERRIAAPPSTRPEKMLYAEGSAARSLERRQRARLARFGWVDRNRRQVHIPIERAIDLVVQEAQQ